MAVSRSLRPYGVGLALGLSLAAAAVAWGPRQQAAAVPTAHDVRELSEVFRNVAAQVMPSVVSIETTTKARTLEPRDGSPFDDDAFPFREFFRDDPRFREFFRAPRSIPRRHGAGSGFIIDPSGLIMTNNHVVAGADEVRVRLSDGREFIAADIKTDPRTDVAVLRIKADGALPALKLGDSKAMQVGDWVLAFGTPFGLEMTVTQGIISGKGRTRGLADREDFLQTDAAINPGNSGGPLVNLSGEVIGINTAIASASGGYDGIGFAIPTHIAGWVSEQLARHGAVKRGYLGATISTVNAETAKQFGVKVGEGAMVRSILPKSPADDAGVEPGDVILKLNHKEITTPASLQGVVEQLEIGKTYPLELVRGGQHKTLQVKIEEMPAEYALARNGRAPRETPGQSFDSLGLQVRTLTPDLARQLGVANLRGVVVSSVKPDSPADRADIASGDVIERVGNTPVATVEEFRKAVEALSLKDGIVLHLRNAEGKRYAIVKADE